MAKETRAEDGPLMDGHKFLWATKRLAFRNDFFHFSHRFALSGGLLWWTCSDSPNFVFETLRNLAICSACRASWWQSRSSNLGLFPNPVFAVLYHTGKPSCCSLWALNKYWISKSSLFASDCWLSRSSHIYFNWKPLPLDSYSTRPPMGNELVGAFQPCWTAEPMATNQWQKWHLRGNTYHLLSTPRGVAQSDLIMSH